MSKTILHIIESLAVGGAEVLLVESLKGFSAEHRHIVVYMRPPKTLLSDLVADKVYFLDYKGKRNIALSILKLRKIIERENVNLIHAHHYWPTVVARLAKPAWVKLVFSVHNLLSADAFHLNKFSLYLEKLTYNKDHHPVFISEAVKNDYKTYIGIKGKSSVINNFVADEYFEPKYRKGAFSSGVLKMVAVGTLKAQKNYSYLIDAFGYLKDYPVYLDIIGEGPCRKQIQAEIENKGLEKVTLKGQRKKPYKVLRNYDAFILASAYEGFGIAMVEAMAVGLPCVLSNIETHREVTGGASLLFDLSSPKDCTDKILNLLQHPNLGKDLSETGKKRAAMFSRKQYLEALNELYRNYLR